ncbi:MAG TPA: glutamine--tRNA ligase/YqeY domain fusion protein [Gemmatimonadales bacterium]
MNGDRTRGTDFIRAMVARDVAAGKWGGRVATRFPPEPNGYLHIGHAKAICVDFGLAEEFGGTCNLRFDDTNPAGEDMRFVEAIRHDIRWLGFEWDDRLRFASDYFEQLHAFAVTLIEHGKAYVDSLSEAEIRAYRGTIAEAGRDSPYRTRSIAENLDLFRRMRDGEFPDGAHVLRGKIDMAHPNMLMRDPPLVRIRHATHYRMGDAWCTYPLYDFTHCLSDAIERITHSLCSLEFKDNRELYDWVVHEVGIVDPPEQTEFARLNLEYTVLSKRKLVRLVSEGHVDGWDDPRLPTLAGLRRRGVTPEAIRTFCDMIGLARTDSRVDIGKLEHAIRDDLNLRAPRVMCVQQPLRLVIENYPEGQVEELVAPYYPHDVPLDGSRTVPFSRVLYIERDDFQEQPPRGYFRLAPGREVRLRYAYYVKCGDVIKDPITGAIIEVRCTYDPATRGGGSPDGRKVQGTVHWVSAEHALPAVVRLYDRLFTRADPDDVAAGRDFISALNPESLVVVTGARIEPSVAGDAPGTRYQFERQGYFISDPTESTPERLVFNRTVALRDTWGRTHDAAATQGGRLTTPRAARAAPTATPAAPAGVPAQAGPTIDATAQGISTEQATILSREPALGALFAQAVKGRSDAASIANWVVNDVRNVMRKHAAAHVPFDGGALAALLDLIARGDISRSQGKSVLGAMFTSGDEPAVVIERLGLQRVADREAIEPLVDRTIAEFPDRVEQYRHGRSGLLGFFVGQVMRASGGTADPHLVEALVKAKLS